MAESRLCELSEVPADGSAAFIADLDGNCFFAMAVRKNDAVYVYENSCPHIGGRLDFPPGEFLSDDGEHIECATHAALFRIEDGVCIFGPCEGDRLTQIKAEVRGDTVYILSD